MEQDRGYVVKEGRALKPESRGRVLTAFLQAYFPGYIDYSFTASLEVELDGVSGAPLRPSNQGCTSWSSLRCRKATVSLIDNLCWQKGHHLLFWIPLMLLTQ